MDFSPERNASRPPQVDSWQAHDEPYLLLFEKNPQSMWLLDPETLAFLEVNEVALKRYGYTREEFLGMTLQDISPPEDVAKLLAYYARLRAEQPRLEVGQAGTWQHRTKDGSPVKADISWSVVPFRGQSALLTLVYDITAQQHAIEALRASEERFRLLVEGTKDYAIFMLDPTGHIISWNVGAERIKGYRTEEILGEHFSRFYTPEDRARGLPQHMLELATREGRVESEGYRVRKDGSTFWANVVITALLDRTGALRGFAKVTRDITERKAAEEALRREAVLLEHRVDERTAALQREVAERRQAETAAQRLNEELVLRIAEFHTLFHVVPVGIGLAEDPACERIRVNPCLADWLGVSFDRNVSLSAGLQERPTTFRIMRDGRVLTPDELPMQYAAAHRVEVRNVELDIIRDDGQCLKLLWNASPLLDDHDQVRGCIAACLDITERTRMEAELKASLAEKEVLLKEIHHRVKNNLQIICSLLNLQGLAVRDPHLQELFHESEHRIHAMALVHETLYQATDLAQLNLARYLRALSTHLFEAYGVDPKRITLTTQIEDLVLPLDMAIPCGLILNELLSNAIKHAFPGEHTGEVAIIFEATPEGYATLQVGDTGVGFPDGFDFRTSDSLGLQLVCALAEQLGGTLSCAPEHGTTFRLTFPLRSS